jgi:GTP diphosphokinase / guanosine-3',5'-bis(diphosphate) 3'-diphosphatase
MDYTIDYILKKGSSEKMPSSSLDSISKAYKFALNYLEDETDKYHGKAITHPLNVAGIVADLNADVTTIIASLLHSTIYESDDVIDKIKDEFGDDVANIITNLAKIDHLKLNDYNESSSLYLRKVLVGLSEDVRVLVIKLADRLDIMRIAYKLPEEERKYKAKETMEVLVPIVHRLGINSIKSELEDLCLKYTKEDAYNEILEKLDGTREELAGVLEDMKNDISDILAEHNINFQIKARVKSVYSIYHKLSTGHKWSDIYDILAMRLIVPSEEDCYLAVGLIHAKYRPVPKRFKDYIAMPKENMYQSLHTSVFGIDGHIFEIQLRTPEMDEIAEHGIASHWSYKEHNSKNIQNLMEQKLELFRNTITMSNEEASDDIFAKNMEEELLSSLIYVFTPKGDVMELPQGATPIDFAYRIHSGVGDTTIGAIVNDQIVPLNYELQDGDIIKINTKSDAKPNKDWLTFVKTAQAKNKIKAYFSKKDREYYIAYGKELLEKEIRKQKLPLNETLSEDNINRILTELKIKDYDELLLSIGSLRYTAIYILNIIHSDKKDIQDIMLDRVNRNYSNTKNNYKNDIIVAGTDNILVTIAACCNPLPGDNIIGYVTKGEGVSVHKKTCPNVQNQSERLIDVKWNVNSDTLFTSSLIVKTNSMTSHLLDIVTISSQRNTSINGIKEYENNGMLDYNVTIKVESKEKLELFIEDLKHANFVVEVKQ